jgi:hypothetical protein
MICGERLVESLDIDVDVDAEDSKASEEEVSLVEERPPIVDVSLESLLHLFRQVKRCRPGRPAAIVAHQCPSSLSVKDKSNNVNNALECTLLVYQWHSL